MVGTSAYGQQAARARRCEGGAFRRYRVIAPRLPQDRKNFLQILISALSRRGDRPLEGDGREDADEVVLPAVMLYDAHPVQETR